MVDPLATAPVPDPRELTGEKETPMRPITASDLMNPNILAVPDSMRLSELALFLVRKEITGAPVRGRSGKLIGVVSMVDLARYLAEEPDLEESDEALVAEDEPCVGDIMTPGVFSVDEDSTVSQIAEAMLNNHLHRLVVTRDEKPVGILSTSDLLGLLVDSDED